MKQIVVERAHRKLPQLDYTHTIGLYPHTVRTCPDTHTVQICASKFESCSSNRIACQVVFSTLCSESFWSPWQVKRNMSGVSLCCTQFHEVVQRKYSFRIMSSTRFMKCSAAGAYMLCNGMQYLFVQFVLLVLALNSIFFTVIAMLLTCCSQRFGTLLPIMNTRDVQSSSAEQMIACW